jgi:hypothetical protein
MSFVDLVKDRLGPVQALEDDWHSVCGLDFCVVDEDPLDIIIVRDPTGRDMSTLRVRAPMDAESAVRLMAYILKQ